MASHTSSRMLRAVPEKPPTPPTMTAQSDELAGLQRFNDTVVDKRSPLARSPGKTPTGPTTPVSPAPIKRPTAPAHVVTRPPSRTPLPATPDASPADAARAQADASDPIAERDKALKMVAAREGILQVVAHDLRNPLNLVKVGGSLLTRMVRNHEEAMAGSEGADPIDPARVTQVADTLVIAVRRMERLITDLLDLEALDKGALRLVRAPANACAIIDEVVIEMRPKAADKYVELVAEKPSHAVVIDCDKDRIAQILENLISNAIKFTPSGKKIVVRLSEEKGEARFEVADEGPGIGDTDLPRIFDPYYRADVPQGRGLGLGLSIVLGLVRAHSGGIWAESATGLGATFVFTMPRRDVTRDTMIEMPAVNLALVSKPAAAIPSRPTPERKR